MGREGIAAEHAAEVLGNLRGVAAKVGQMAGYVDGVVPEPLRPFSLDFSRKEKLQ